MTSYKPHYACFDCRKTFKRRLLADVQSGRAASVASHWFRADAQKAPAGEPQSVPARCPDCGGLVASMGLDFKAPPKDDRKAWQHLRSLYAAGIAFHSCGCGGPGYVPASIAELRALLSERKREYVKNLGFWLNKPVPNTQQELMLDRQHNYVQYGYVTNLAGRKGGVDPQEAVTYWNARIAELDQRLGALPLHE